MISMGLVPKERNPFVFDGVPRTGQVWSAITNPNHCVVILKYDDYYKRVTYRTLQVGRGVHSTDVWTFTRKLRFDF